MTDYELFLKLVDDEISEEDLFYFSLKNKNFDNIFRWANNTKELKKEYPSIVYKGQNIAYYELEYNLQSNNKYVNTNIGYFDYIHIDQFEHSYMVVSEHSGNVRRRRALISPLFSNLVDAEKYKNKLLDIK